MISNIVRNSKKEVLVPLINKELVYYRANIDDRNYIYFDLLNSSWTYYFSKWDNNTHIQSMNFNSEIYPIKNIDSYNGLTLRLEQYEGRNPFTITQQPTRANGYKATIHMFDPQHGANWYSLRLFIVSAT